MRKMPAASRRPPVKNGYGLLYIEECQHLATVLTTRLGVDWRHGSDERVVLVSCELENLAALCANGGHRVFLFFDVQFALEPNRVLHRPPQFLLQRARPRIECRPVQKDGTGQIEVIRRGM